MKKILTDVAAFADGHDLSCDTNTLSVEADVEVQDATVFCSDGWREFLAGLKTGTYTFDGYWQAGEATIDEEFADLGTSLLTVAESGDDGTTAYLMRTVESQFNRFGAIGAVTPFTLAGSVRSSEGMVLGALLLPKQTVSGDTTGNGVQLGPATADQKVYVAIHCLDAGTTADVSVESDDNSGFTSATERSSSTITAAGGTFVTVDGPITDTHWRVVVDTVTGDFDLAVAVGIA